MADDVWWDRLVTALQPYAVLLELLVNGAMSAGEGNDELRAKFGGIDEEALRERGRHTLEQLEAMTGSR